LILFAARLGGWLHAHGNAEPVKHSVLHASTGGKDCPDWAATRADGIPYKWPGVMNGQASPLGFAVIAAASMREDRDRTASADMIFLYMGEMHQAESRRVKQNL
jgi:hypothetical protein